MTRLNIVQILSLRDDSKPLVNSVPNNLVSAGNICVLKLILVVVFYKRR